MLGISNTRSLVVPEGLIFKGNPANFEIYSEESYITLELPWSPALDDSAPDIEILSETLDSYDGMDQPNVSSRVTYSVDTWANTRSIRFNVSATHNMYPNYQGRGFKYTTELTINGVAFQFIVVTNDDRGNSFELKPIISAENV